MPASLRNATTSLLVALAIAVAVVTAIRILDLPAVGTVRYPAADSRSSLSQLRSSLEAVGIAQTDGTIQNLIRTRSNPLAFRAPTYWSNLDVASRRDEYLAAGAVLAGTLLLSAFVLGRRPVRE